MLEDRITVCSEPRQNFDKMQLALAIRNGTYEDNLSCSLLLNGVLPNCNNCTLKLLCDEIDTLSENYTKQTTNIVGSFCFNE